VTVLTGDEQTGTASGPVWNDVCLLTLDVAESRPNTTVVTATGEIDLAAVWQLADCLGQLVHAAHKVVFDMSGVVHCSSSGVTALIQASDQASGVGGEFCLVVPALRHPMRRLLGMLELLDYLDVRPSLALAHVPR
jgi:anti-sigma B factor antagonist